MCRVPSIAVLSNHKRRKMVTSEGALHAGEKLTAHLLTAGDQIILDFILNEWVCRSVVPPLPPPPPPPPPRLCY